MKFILFAGLLLLTQQQICLKYTCMEDITENKDRCLIAGADSYKVRKCGSGQACNTMESISIQKCGTAKKKDQESCTTGNECFSGTCTDKKCIGKSVGTTCLNHLECAKNLLCNGSCEEFKTVGAECTSDIHCPFGYGCGKNKEDENKATCIKLYSIASGQYSIN